MVGPESKDERRYQFWGTTLWLTPVTIVPVANPSIDPPLNVTLNVVCKNTPVFNVKVTKEGCSGIVGSSQQGTPQSSISDVNADPALPGSIINCDTTCDENIYAISSPTTVQMKMTPGMGCAPPGPDGYTWSNCGGGYGLLSSIDTSPVSYCKWTGDLSLKNIPDPVNPGPELRARFLAPVKVGFGIGVGGYRFQWGSGTISSDKSSITGKTIDCKSDMGYIASPSTCEGVFDLGAGPEGHISLTATPKPTSTGFRSRFLGWGPSAEIKQNPYNFELYNPTTLYAGSLMGNFSQCGGMGQICCEPTNDSPPCDGGNVCGNGYSFKDDFGICMPQLVLTQPALKPPAGGIR